MTNQNKRPDSPSSHRFNRTSLLLGPEAMAKLTHAHVTLVGLGAVGGFALESLARSGVGNIRLVDFDILRESNINRQILALSSTLGKPKIRVARERVLEINPDIQLQCFETFCHEDSFDEIFQEPTDIVIDAIDSVTPKLKLLELLHHHQIPVISSMGAALRTDPFSVTVADISETKVCPLAARIRRELRRRGIRQGIRCVYSQEQPVKWANPPESPLQEEEYYKRGRERRTVGSIAHITGIFGCVIASEVIQHLIS